ncbi:MAG: LrgB family protein [Spirochaetia bacterium]|nr:LrgB family protein [Spirochaetia bacterium]
MKEEILNNPFFGVILSLVSFRIGERLFEKTKLAVFNPFLISLLICIAFLKFFDIPLEWYNKGGDIIAFFLAPATVALALPLYRQLPLLRRYAVPVAVGGLVGAVTAIVSVVVFGKLLGIDNTLLVSFLPKSITTPLGLELSRMIGGVPAITVVAIMITGLTGNILSPVVFRLCRISHPVAKGLGLGVSSHVFGTNRALEMGETEGAMSALALVFAGLLTVGLAPLLKFLFGL